MPIDTRELIGKGGKSFDLITDDRLCDQCRYNLKGLPSNGKCPECGRPIRRRRSKRFADHLVDAPAFYLRTLTLGLALLAVFSVVSSFAFHALERRWTLASAAIAGMASLGWWVGVFITTAPRAFSDNMMRDPLLDAPWMRHINRGMQAFWILAAVMWVAVLRLPAPANQYAWFAAKGMQLVGSFGLAVLAVQLSSLADWAGDTGLSERFKISAWAMAACGILAEGGGLVGGFKGPVTGLLWLGSIWATLGRSVAQVLFLVSLVQLAVVAVWAVRNASTASEADRRLQERRERHERELGARTAAALALQERSGPKGPAGPTRSRLDANVLPNPGRPKPPQKPRGSP
jgi:hypothetical protein